jgi:hypothetical protein
LLLYFGRRALDKLIASSLAVAFNGKVCKIMVDSFLLDFVLIQAFLEIDYLAIAATLAFLEKGVWVNQIHDGPVY